VSGQVAHPYTATGKIVVYMWLFCN
jgi:hypothetical protein